MKYSKPQIHEIIATAVARSLACELKEVTPKASLFDDLGMDSLDFLDVIFSLEKTFQIKLLGNKINKLLRPDGSQQDPYLNQEEIDHLAPYLPALKTASSNNEKIPHLDLFKLVTAETLVALVLSETENNTASK